MSAAAHVCYGLTSCDIITTLKKWGRLNAGWIHPTVCTKHLTLSSTSDIVASIFCQAYVRD